MSTSTVLEQAVVPAGTWNVDPAHSSVEFLVDAMGFNLVRGLPFRASEVQEAIEAML